MENQMAKTWKINWKLDIYCGLYGYSIRFLGGSGGLSRLKRG